jgi:serine/threonine protein phosphatase PrpC
MEDSHIANVDIGDGVSIFGVFDGHGGRYNFSIFLKF